MKVAEVSSECTHGRKLYFGVLQYMLKEKMASRGSDLINKRKKDEIQKDYLKAHALLCYF